MHSHGQQDINPFNLVSLSAATRPNHTFRLSYNKDWKAATILIHIMSNNSLTGQQTRLSSRPAVFETMSDLGELSETVLYCGSILLLCYQLLLSLVQLLLQHGHWVSFLSGLNTQTNTHRNAKEWIFLQLSNVFSELCSYVRLFPHCCSIPCARCPGWCQLSQTGSRWACVPLPHWTPCCWWWIPGPYRAGTAEHRQNPLLQLQRQTQNNAEELDKLRIFLISKIKWSRQRWLNSLTPP